MKQKDFFDSIVAGTEKLLTWRKKRKLREKLRQQNRSPVLDWAYAIIWAACVVLVINQYLFQNYRIPSGSMEKTLLVGDMIFVDKLTYGPELLPGVLKTPGIAQPRRGDIVIFENPSYLSKGPFFTIAKQLLYMLTFTLVDIDREQNGEPRVQYLIKRAVGMPGDTIRVRNGEVFIRPRGSSSFIEEKSLMEGLGLPWKRQRLVASADYAEIRKTGIAAAYSELGLRLPQKAENPLVQKAYLDAFQYDMVRSTVLRDADPSDARYAAIAQRYANGWYLSGSRIFPMGDNRDNSRDARYFGPVRREKVLGRALFKYWPIGRMGSIR
ncbi:MAG: signal peptidase I [Rectinemataceae bacterium]|nr:signal peptidase I [Spirochaetaceae bacterium]